VTVVFGPSRSKRFRKAVAEAQSGVGECRELEPGRYEVRFLLGEKAAAYAGLARLLEHVRHWRATEVFEDEEKAASFHAKDIKIVDCLSHETGWQRAGVSSAGVLCSFSVGASPTCLGQPVVGARECVGWCEPSPVKGGRQVLARVSGESPSISKQIRAPAAMTSAPSTTAIEVIARGQRSWTASCPASSIRPRSRAWGRWESR